MSNNFKVKFGELKLRDHDNFKEISKEEYTSLKNWYKNRFRGLVKPKSSTSKIPHIEYPNEVLMNLLGDTVAVEHK